MAKTNESNDMITTLSDTIKVLEQMLKMDPKNKGVRDLIERNKQQLNYLKNGMSTDDMINDKLEKDKLAYADEGSGDNAIEDDSMSIRDSAKNIKKSNKQKLIDSRQALHDKQLEETGYYAPIEGDDSEGNMLEIDAPALSDDEKLDIFFQPFIDGKSTIPDGEANNIFDFASTIASDIKDQIDDIKYRLHGNSAKIDSLENERSELLGRLDDINTILVSNGLDEVENNGQTIPLKQLDAEQLSHTDKKLTQQVSQDAIDRLNNEYFAIHDRLNDVDSDLDKEVSSGSDTPELSEEERAELNDELSDAVSKYDMFKQQLSYFTQFLDKKGGEKATNYSNDEYSDLLDRLSHMHINNVNPDTDTFSRFPGSHTKGIFNGAPAEYGRISNEEYAQAADILKDIYSEEYVKNPDEPVDPSKLIAAGIDPTDNFRLFQACMSFPDMQYINKQMRSLANRNRAWKWQLMKNDGDDALPISAYDDMPRYQDMLRRLYDARYNVQSFRWDPEAFERDRSKKLLASSEERLRNTLAGQKDIEKNANIDYFRNKNDNLALAKFLKLNGEDNENGEAVTLPPPSDTDIKIQFFADKDDLYEDRIPTSIQFVDKQSGNVVHEVARSVPRSNTQDLVGILQTLTSDPISMTGHTDIGMIGANPGKSYVRYNSGLENAFRTGDWSLYDKYIGGNKREQERIPVMFDPDTGEVVYSNGSEFSENNVNSIFSPYNANYLNGMASSDLFNNPTGIAKKFGYNDKTAMLEDLDTMDDSRLQSILKDDSIKDKFSDKDALKDFLANANDIDIKQYADELKKNIISKRQAGLKSSISRREKKFIDSLNTDSPGNIRRTLIKYAEALQKLPNANSGKRLTKGAGKAIGRDLNLLRNGVVDEFTLNDVARKYFNKTKGAISANDRYQHRNDTAMNDIKRMRDLGVSLKDAKDNGNTSEFERLGGQKQLDLLHAFLSNIDNYYAKHSNLKKGQDISSDPALLDRTFANQQLTIRGADTPSYDGLLHPQLVVTTAKRPEEDIQNMYGNTTFAKNRTKDKREDSYEKRAYRRQSAFEGAKARQNFEYLYNNKLSEEEKRKNENAFRHPHKETEEDRILRNAFSKSGAGSGARFSRAVDNYVDDELGNVTAESTVYNMDQDNSDISASDKNAAHKNKVEAKKAAGKKEESLTPEEKEAKRKDREERLNKLNNYFKRMVPAKNKDNKDSSDNKDNKDSTNSKRMVPAKKKNKENDNEEKD